MKNAWTGVIIVFFFSGCATVMSPKTQSINITTSNDEAVEVTIDDKTLVTPGMVVVVRNGLTKTIKTHADGCAVETPVKRNLSVLFLGNVFIGGVLGSTLDILSGRSWNYADNVEVLCNE